MPIGRSKASVISALTIDQDIPMATYKLTGLGAGSATGHSVRYQQAILQAILTTAGDMLVRGASVAGRLAKGTSGEFLKQGATYAEWANAYLIDLLTTRGDIVYRGASAPLRLAKGNAAQVLTMGANDPAWSAVPSRLTVAETEVFNGTAPTTETDLDLNAVVGTNAAIVMLKITYAGESRYWVRKNGDTDDFEAGILVTAGCAIAMSTSGKHVVVLVATDDAGIIEWACEDARATVIDVIAFWT